MFRMIVLCLALVTVAVVPLLILVGMSVAGENGIETTTGVTATANARKSSSRSMGARWNAAGCTRVGRDVAM
jgi:hypothetical protein